MVQLAPIALFVYNRPEHTRETVECLMKNPESSESNLVIFSDAAKHESSREHVNDVRSYIREISGFRSVTIVERDENWGLARSVVDGVTRLCNDYGRVIVLEDDLRVSPQFLRYMNEGLTRFQNQEKVMQIAGYMFPVQLELIEDALFLPLTSSWGWGTWQRAWQHLDMSASGYGRIAGDSALRHAFDLEGRYPYFKMLKSQLDGSVDSWAILWYLTVFLRKGLVLYPRKSLVENFGFDGSGVNCAVSGFAVNPIDPAFKIDSFPENIEVSPVFNSLIQKLPKTKFSIRAYINRLLKKSRFKV